MQVSSGTKYTSSLFLTCKAKDAAPIKWPNLVDFVRLAKPKPRARLRNWAEYQNRNRSPTVGSRLLRTR
jgi:hypothetical protein